MLHVLTTVCSRRALVKLKQERIIHVTFEGEKAPATPQVPIDLVLVAVGRTPNGKKLDADKAGVSGG